MAFFAAASLLPGLALEVPWPAPGEALAVVDRREQMFLQAEQPITHFGYRTPAVEQARAASLWLADRPERARALVPARLLEPSDLTALFEGSPRAARLRQDGRSERVDRLAGQAPARPTPITS